MLEVSHPAYRVNGYIVTVIAVDWPNITHITHMLLGLPVVSL